MTAPATQARRKPDTCFVAMTRPAVKFGVPLEGYLANLVGTMVFTCGIMGNPLYFTIGLAVHMVMREKTKKDPHFWWQWRLWFGTKLKSTTAHVWGASRLQPSPTYLRGPRDMAVSL